MHQIPIAKMMSKLMTMTMAQIRRRAVPSVPDIDRCTLSVDYDSRYIVLYDAIIAAFTSALKDRRQWDNMNRGEDRFAAFEDSPVYQVPWLESSSIQALSIGLRKARTMSRAP